MSVAAESTLTGALLDALQGEGWRIGDGRAPDGAANAPPAFYPYGVLYVGTTLMTGSALAPKEDGLHRVQVTCVGKTRASAQWLRDQIAAFLLGPRIIDLPIDGHAVVWTSHEGSPTPLREDDVTPPRFSAPLVVNLFVTTAPSGS